jgi:hypothetical protein
MTGMSGKMPLLLLAFMNNPGRKPKVVFEQQGERKGKKDRA